MSIEGKIIPNAGDGGGEASVSPRLTRRHLLMGGALLAVSGLALARTPKQRYPALSDKQFEALFPRHFANWRTMTASELVMPPESEMANKLYQHILTRTYVNDQGVAIMFLAAYNNVQLNNVQLHRPEVCYYASGFSIDMSRPYDVPLGSGETIAARAVKATMGSRDENILYWTRIGEEMPQSWAAQRISMTKANLEGYLADGLLLRMSIISPNTEQALQQMVGFVKEMLAHSGNRTRSLMTGIA
ncbi:MAG: EpsI family protein [Sphingomonadales bacterium]|nr:EpsI family protein [Sphingomonadales bacterium]